MSGKFTYDKYYNVYRLNESHNINYKLVFSGGTCMLYVNGFSHTQMPLWWYPVW